MKKSNARFFHGEPVFSGEQYSAFPERTEMHKYAFPCFPHLTSYLSPILVQLVQLLLPYAYARAGGTIISKKLTQKLFLTMICV